MTGTASDQVRRRAGRSKGDLREEQILDAVRALLAEKSMAAVTIDDITTAAGISRTAFYFYFPSKQAVLARLMEQVGTRFGETHGWLATDGPSPQELRAQLDGAAAVWRENGPILACTLQGAGAVGYAPLEDFIADVRARFVSALTAKVDRDQTAGLAPDGIAPATLAELVELMREGRLAQLAALPTEEMSVGLEELAEAILRLVYGRAD